MSTTVKVAWAGVRIHVSSGLQSPIHPRQPVDHFRGLSAFGAAGTYSSDWGVVNDELIELVGGRGDMAELRRLADLGSTTVADQLRELTGE